MFSYIRTRITYNQLEVLVSNTDSLLYRAIEIHDNFRVLHALHGQMMLCSLSLADHLRSSSYQHAQCFSNPVVVQRESMSLQHLCGHHLLSASIVHSCNLNVDHWYTGRRAKMAYRHFRSLASRVLNHTCKTL